MRLLFAGRLVDLKGAHTAVAALPMLGHEVRLSIVGDRQDLAYVERLDDEIARLGVADRIDFAEPVAAAALPALFAAHDIYLFPSFYEPFSLTLIHALANGIPTIASDAGGNLEIVRDRDTGMLFRKGDAAALARIVTELVQKSALRARIAERGPGGGGRLHLRDHDGADGDSAGEPSLAGSAPIVRSIAPSRSRHATGERWWSA